MPHDVSAEAAEVQHERGHGRQPPREPSDLGHLQNRPDVGHVRQQEGAQPDMNRTEVAVSSATSPMRLSVSATTTGRSGGEPRRGPPS